MLVGMRCLGLVLTVLEFRERDRIATLFTPGGVVKVFVRGRGRLPLWESLVEGEFVLAEGKRELWRYRDGSISEQHLAIRERFESMEAAGRVIRALLESQWQEKEAPGLYQLTCMVLRMIPLIDRPEDLVSLFLIKTLKHEGLLQMSGGCSVCEGRAQLRHGGEQYCTAHAPLDAVELSDAEERELHRLAEGKQLKELLAQPLTINKKAELLFAQTFDSKRFTRTSAHT